MKASKYILFLLSIYLYTSHCQANTHVISDNGKTATLTLPLKAEISVDSIMRDEITVAPLSGLFEKVTWDKGSNKFRDHQFVLRVIKDTEVPLLFEIINDQYTCSYNNPDWTANLPDTIAVVNSEYSYGVAWSGGSQTMTASRSAVIDAPGAWRPEIGSINKFIDLTLMITFPDVSKHSLLMSKGGVCQGSITMLVSNKL